MKNNKDKYKNPIYSKVITTEEVRKQTEVVVKVKGGEVVVEDKEVDK